MARPPKHPKAPDPYQDLQVGDVVMLGTACIDPEYWHVATVLWIDDGRRELLVRQHGIAGSHTHNALQTMDYVRVYGTLEHCGERKRKAAAACRDAARLAQDVADQARDLQRRMTEVFETLATAALKSCGARP